MRTALTTCSRGRRLGSGMDLAFRGHPRGIRRMPGALSRLCPTCSRNAMKLAIEPKQRATPPRTLRATVLATTLLGAMLVAGCNRAEAPETAPAAPATSAPSAPAASPGAAPGSAAPAPGSNSSSQSAQPPSSGGTSTPAGGSPTSPAPAQSSSPSSSAATPGTPDGARSTLPSSDAAVGSKPTGGTSADAKETDPKGELTKKEESQGMPEALQAGNNHSSTALDTEPKKP